MVHGEPAPVTVTGRVVTGGAADRRPTAGARPRCCSTSRRSAPIPTTEARRTPWTRWCPSRATGAFRGRSCRRTASTACSRYAFGAAGRRRRRRSRSARADRRRGRHHRRRAGAPAGRRPTSRAGHAARRYAELVLVPVGRPTPAAVPPPLLRAVRGLRADARARRTAVRRRATARSPPTGRFDLLVPPGRYYVYATRGPFATPRSHDGHARAPASRYLADADLRVAAGACCPAGPSRATSTSTAPRSYDSSIPDQDRVVSFLAAGVDVIVATDHDVVTTYEDTIADSANARPTGDHPGRRADAQHPVVRRARARPSRRRWGTSTSGRWRRATASRRATARPGTSCASRAS